MIDLHLHSTRSDGSASPREIVDLAVEAGCSAIALTDHDGLAGVDEAQQRADEVGIGFVAGCEVSCTDVHGTIHLLGYFVEPGGALDGTLARLREDRARRNDELLDKLRWLGAPLDRAALATEAGGGVIGRPHFAALLVQNGHAASIEDAFNRYLGEGRAAYVPRASIPPSEVIDLARADGAVIALAHPLSTGLDPTALARYVASLAERGLVGLESIYAGYDPDSRAALVALARRVGLVPTGGSDFHGRYKPGLSVGSGRGDLCVPDEVLDELAARRSTRPSA